MTACGGVLRRQVEALDAKTEEEFREGLTLPAVIGSADTEIDEEAIASRAKISSAEVLTPVLRFVRAAL